MCIQHLHHFACAFLFASWSFNSHSQQLILLTRAIRRVSLPSNIAIEEWNTTVKKGSREKGKLNVPGCAKVRQLPTGWLAWWSIYFSPKVLCKLIIGYQAVLSNNNLFGSIIVSFFLIVVACISRDKMQDKKKFVDFRLLIFACMKIKGKTMWSVFLCSELKKGPWHRPTTNEPTCAGDFFFPLRRFGGFSGNFVSTHMCFELFFAHCLTCKVQTAA